MFIIHFAGIGAVVQLDQGGNGLITSETTGDVLPINKLCFSLRNGIELFIYPFNRNDWQIVNVDGEVFAANTRGSWCIATNN